MPADKTVEILLVEDNEADIRLTKEGLAEAKINNNLYVARDGEEAMKFLRKNGKHNGAATPDLILLDLNLPKKDGREVLREIKEDKKLAHIPVVILTTSEADKDIVKSYKLHANCYVSKPMGIDQFVEVITAIENFWFKIVKLPPEM